MSTAAPPSSPWAALLPAALAGTRRQPFAPLPGFTPPLGSEADAPEKLLLLTAASLRLAQRLGARPLPGPACDLGRAHPETRPALAATHVQLLRELLQNIDASGVWGACFEQLAGYGRLACLDQLTLVRELPAFPRQTLQQPDANGLGSARRHWLAACEVGSHHWYAHRAQPLTTGWWLAEPRQRYTNLHLLGRQRPPGGWEWLLAELQAGTPEQQGELLGVLHGWAATETVPTNFAPVLEALLAHRAGFDAAEALVQLPGNALLERHWARAEPLLTYDPDTARLTATPVAWQDAWGRDQLNTHPYHPSPMPHEQQMLRQLLSWVPPTRWLHRWHLSAAEAVELAATGDYGAAVLGGWLDAAARYRDPDVVLAVLDALTRYPLLLLDVCGEKPRYSPAGPALAVVPPARRVAWLLSQLPALPLTEQAVAGHTALGFPVWSLWLEDGIATDLPALGLALLDWLLAALAPPARSLPRNARYVLGQLLALLTTQAAAALPLLPRLETELLPQLQAWPGHPLTAYLEETVERLGYYRDFTARLADLAAAPARA